MARSRKRRKWGTYLGRVARRQEVRFDGRLPKAWLEAALWRFKNQRITCAISTDEHKRVQMNAIYMGVKKLSRANEFALQVRDFSVEGRRLGRGRRQRKEMVTVPLDIVVETPQGDPFWRALTRQRVAVTLTKSVRSEGR